MKKELFLTNVKKNCTEILHLSTKHMLDKLYHDDAELNNINDFFANYRNYHLYLNDYAGIIYSRYASSVDTLYIEMCNYLKIEIDNKYTLEHVIGKLEKQTPHLLLNLTNEDIQIQTISHFEEKLLSINASNYYRRNIDEFQCRIDKLEKNIALVKNALKL
jgi:uncharacterized coiled-coil DUF342 family protein